MPKERPPSPREEKSTPVKRKRRFISVSCDDCPTDVITGGLFRCSACETEFRASAGVDEDDLVCPNCHLANLSGVAEETIAFTAATPPKVKSRPRAALTVHEVTGIWEGVEAEVKFGRPEVLDAFEQGQYGTSEMDKVQLELARQVHEKIVRLVRHDRGVFKDPHEEAASLVAALRRWLNLLDPQPSTSIQIDPSVLADIAALHGPDAVKGVMRIASEEARRRIDEFKRRRNSANLTYGEHYLQYSRSLKGGYFYPGGEAGEFLRGLEQQLGHFLGSQGLLTNRLYDLLKVAGVVPEPDEPWERSRARAVRVELHNAVCYATTRRILYAVRDKLVINLRKDEPCTPEEAEYGHRVGRDFTNRSEFEEWFVGSWEAWMAEAATEAQRLGGFALEGRQIDLWNRRTALLFGQEGRQHTTESFTTYDMLPSVLLFLQERLTPEALAKIPVRSA